MKIYQTKVVEKTKMHFMINTSFPENRAVDGIMWNNIVEPNRPQTTVWRMRIAFWITKATNTHSQYVILIAVPLQQWLHERASVLRYTYIVCLVCVWYIVARMQTKFCRSCPHSTEG